MVVVSAEIFFADEQVVVTVQLPELAVDDIEMLVREVVCDLVDVVFVLQPTYCLSTSSSSSSSSPPSASSASMSVFPPA